MNKILNQFFYHESESTIFKAVKGVSKITVSINNNNITTIYIFFSIFFRCGLDIFNKYTLYIFYLSFYFFLL